MKRQKTHRSPMTDLQRLAHRVQEYRLPSGPFDYAERARAMEEAQGFFQEVVQACRSHHADPEAKAVIEAARRLYERAWEMAYPPGFWEDYERLRSGDPAGMGSAVSFLEADPWFDQSGYVKEKIIRSLKPAMMTLEYSARLRAVILRIVDQRDGREFRAYCRLARKVDSPELREQLRQRLTRAWPSARSLTDDLPALMLMARQDRAIRRRARWVLEALGEKSSQG